MQEATSATRTAYSAYIDRRLGKSWEHNEKVEFETSPSPLFVLAKSRFRQVLQGAAPDETGSGPYLAGTAQAKAWTGTNTNR
jgi:hypothetical protein